MIVIDPNKITGERLVRIIDKAVADYSKKTGVRASRNDLIRNSGLSKQQVIRYVNGARPGMMGVHKIANALERWGFEVEVKKLNVKA